MASGETEFWSDDSSYRELGCDYLDKQKPEATAKRLVKRLEPPGFQVTLQTSPLPV